MPGSKAFTPSCKAFSKFMDPMTRSSVALIGNSTTVIASAPSSIGGNRFASARTAVDLAVPFSPSISTPPMDGLIALSKRANFISSCPTIAVNGYNISLTSLRIEKFYFNSGSIDMSVLPPVCLKSSIFVVPLGNTNIRCCLKYGSS